MSSPWDFQQATNAARQASNNQQAAEDFVRETARTLAEKERQYREALAREIVQQRAQGVAWSVAADIARGAPDVARLRMERDIAEGVRDAAGQAAWRRSADRRDVQSFVAWSMRRELAEAGLPVPDGSALSVIGGRRVA